MSQPSFIFHPWKQSGINNYIDSSTTLHHYLSRKSEAESAEGDEAVLSCLNLQFLLNLEGHLPLTLNRASHIFKCFATKFLTTQKGGWYGKIENNGNKLS